MDKDQADFDKALAQVKERFGDRIFPLNIPVNPGPGFNQVLDVLRSEIVTYEPDTSGRYQEGPASGAWAERVNVLHKQLIEHIAESDEAAMSRMEAEMAASESAARKAVSALKDQLPSAAAPQLAAAAAALDRFKAVNAEIVSLSRRNSNVRSLALSLGRKRAVTAECDDTLRALEEALTKHDFKATR